MSSILPYPKPSVPDDLRRQLDRLSPDERVQVLRTLLGEAACRQLGIFPLPPGFKLSVVMPVFNELPWLAEVLRRVRAAPVRKEIIIVDDCSTDGTRDLLRSLEGDDDLRILY